MVPMSEIDEFHNLHSATSVVKLQVLAYLLRSQSSGGKSVLEICDAIGVQQSAVSHHLQWMRKHGLIKGKRMGKQIYYKLTDSTTVFALLDASSQLASLQKMEAKI